MALEPVTPELKWFLFEGLRSFSSSDSLWYSLLDQQFYLPPAGKDLWCYGQQTSSHIQLQRGLETGRLLLWSLWPFNIPSHAHCSRGWDITLANHINSLSHRNVSLVWNPVSFCPITAERDFLDSLPFSQQCTEEEKELLRFLYENKLKKVQRFFVFLWMLFSCNFLNLNKTILGTKYWSTYLLITLTV